MAFGIPGITAPPQPVPVNPIDPLNPKTPAGSGPSPNASPPMTPDRVQRSSDAATNPNAYHDAIVRVYGASGTAAISAPDHATKTDAALTHGAASQSVKATSAAQKIVAPPLHRGHETDVRASEHASNTAKRAVAESAVNAGSGSSWLGTAGSFVKGVGEGAWDGGSGMVQGVGDLAKGGYNLATSADARSQTADTISKGATAAGDFAKTTITDPAKAAGQVGHAASRAWNSVSTAYQQAQASGNRAEFIGKAVGQGAVLAATLPVPGGAEAKSAAALGEAGRMTEVTSDLGKAADGAADAAKALHAASRGASETAVSKAASTTEPATDATDSATTTASTTSETVKPTIASIGAKSASTSVDAQITSNATKTTVVRYSDNNKHPTVDLLAAEKGGRAQPHTLQNHVNDQHTERFATTKISRSSTYNDLASAQRSTDDLINRPENQIVIGKWLDGGASKPLTLRGTVDGDPIGRTISRADFEAGHSEEPTKNVRTVLVKDSTSPAGYTVLTSFPDRP